MDWTECKKTKRKKKSHRESASISEYKNTETKRLKQLTQHTAAITCLGAHGYDEAATTSWKKRKKNRETRVRITVTFSQFMWNELAVVAAASEQSRMNTLTHSLVSQNQTCLMFTLLLVRDVNPFTLDEDCHFWQTANISSTHIRNALRVQTCPLPRIWQSRRNPCRRFCIVCGDRSPLSVSSQSTRTPVAESTCWLRPDLWNQVLQLNVARLWLIQPNDSFRQKKILLIIFQPNVWCFWEVTLLLLKNTGCYCYCNSMDFFFYGKAKEPHSMNMESAL